MGVTLQNRLANRLGVLLLVLATAPGVDQATAQSAKRAPNKPTAWQDDKVAVRVDEPYISKGGLLILAYTLTNNSGADLVLFRDNAKAEPEDILKGNEEVKLFRRLKSSNTYDEISKANDSIVFFKSSLPTDVPVRFLIGFQVSKQEESWWSKKKELTAPLAIERLLSDVNAIVLLLPGRRIRIVLPIKR